MDINDIIGTLSTEEAFHRLSENMWNLFSNDILTGRIFVYEGMEILLFRSVN